MSAGLPGIIRVRIKVNVITINKVGMLCKILFKIVFNTVFSPPFPYFRNLRIPVMQDLPHIL
ncbi:hypothetical protein RUMHYD_02293 [Blautia hydrogenotrophica DSM 10507]|uniref:Uncharacterized protein n=1 Tax=Blautia hydrogenotrophica (strain DSM 10507 / JCM 14656 / S5a33) TaxID=476272 RepID=C0CN54_BLAHS|nr:hypothetical protein RUMHYD_02293 [Blautia hydrogenotrophica DSM 10507]